MKTKVQTPQNSQTKHWIKSYNLVVHSLIAKQTLKKIHNFLLSLLQTFFITAKASKCSFLNNQPFLKVIATVEEQERKSLPACICSIPCVGSSSSLYRPFVHTPLPRPKPEAQNATVTHISQAHHTVFLHSLQQGTFIFLFGKGREIRGL